MHETTGINIEYDTEVYTYITEEYTYIVSR